MINAWLLMNDGTVFVSIAILYTTSGLSIYWLYNRPSMRRILADFKGIAGLLTPMIFVMTTAFLGAAVWQNFSVNADSVRKESHAIISFIQITRVTPGLENKGFTESALDYVHSALEVEWPLLENQHYQSARTSAVFDNLITKIAAVAIAPDTPPVIGATLMRWADTLTLARVARVGNAQTDPDTTRWICVLLLAMLMQIAVASLYIDRPRQMAAALAIDTCSTIVMLGMIALSVETHSGLLSVSKEPMEQILMMYSTLGPS